MAPGSVSVVFSPGTHIRVARHLRFARLKYWHHGICVQDSQVIEFGGGTLFNKGRTQIRRVSLASFARGMPIEAVSHPITWIGWTYSPLLPPEQVMDRAEWLVSYQPPPYRLGYRNCESIAIWCATGDFESFQVKKFILIRALIIPLLTIAAFRWKRWAGWAVMAVGHAITLVTTVPYNSSWALYKHTRCYPGIGNWQPRE